MKKKYITTQLESYGAFGVEITRLGFETDDEELIAKLEASPDYCVWFYPSSTVEQVEEMKKEWARQVLDSEPIEVEAVSAGNIDDELEALAEENRIKEEQEQAEADELQARREKDLQYKERFKPNAAKAKKATMEARAAKEAAKKAAKK